MLRCVVYGTVGELGVWQRVTRREADELFSRFGDPSTRTDLTTTPIDGAELLCPACSSEARPDETDTATCGSCGTLSPLDAAVAFSNYIHLTLHSGIRLRAAMVDGQGGPNVPDVSEPFPRILVRVGSLLVMAAVKGMRRSDLDQMLSSQSGLLRRWVQKEVEDGDRDLAGNLSPKATGAELVHEILERTVGPLPNGFPKDDSVAFALEQVFHAASQYHKFHTSSLYAALVAERLNRRLRDALDLDEEAPLPWKYAAVLAKSLYADARGEHVLDRYRGSDEALARAVVAYLSSELGRVQAAFGRHRVSAQMTV